MGRKIILVTLLTLSLQSGLMAVQQTKKTAQKIVSTGNIYSGKEIACLMGKVFQWQIDNPIAANEQHWNQWARSVFYAGVMCAYKTTKNETYLDQTIKWGNSWKWSRGVRYRDADDLVCGQAYLDVYSVKNDSKMLVKIQSAIDSLIADPKAGREDWWWCDALFMAPPVLARLGVIANNPKYNSYLDKMYWDATDYLYSPSDSLFFRDKSFFNATTKNGKKVFWSRGNAWVIGGLTQLLGIMPKDNPSRPKYLALYLKMIYKIASLQQPDGLWRASLLDPLEIPVKETSGSTFFTYAMTWGVNNKILPEKIFLPKIKKGWLAIVQSINEEGKLGYVQPIAAKPENVNVNDFQEYGSGSFLMVGSEMINLSRMLQMRNTISKNRDAKANNKVKTQLKLSNTTKLVMNP